MESPTRQRIEPQQRRSVERYERAVETAEAMVADRGFEDVTMTDVAADAGLSIGALYRWFPDRDALGVEVAKRVMRRVAPFIGDDVEHVLRDLADRVPADRAAVSIVGRPIDRPGPGRVVHDHLERMMRPLVVEPARATVLAILARGMLQHLAALEAPARPSLVDEFVIVAQAYVGQAVLSRSSL